MLSLLLVAVQATPPIWIEAETADAPAAFVRETPGPPDRVSGGQWIKASADPEGRDRLVPAEGLTLRHTFRTPAGRREIWNRVGFEFARSPFEWRLDGGEWRTASPDDLTKDLVPLAEWTEVGWLKLGEADLKEGDHVLEIRITRRSDKDGKPERTLYASDAIAIVAPGWAPRGPIGDGPKVRLEPPGVFAVPSRDSDKRAVVKLAGEWEIRRDDEDLPPFDIETPMEPIQNRDDWTRIAVPADRNKVRPELAMAHRVWYRTTFTLPEGANRSVRLSFPRNSLHTTVRLNGKTMGASYDPLVRWDVDVTPAAKAGPNVLEVGIRDPYYAYSGSPTNPMKRRKTFNYPLSFFGRGFQDFGYPVWNASYAGILETPVLTVTGPVAVTDAFVRPQVRTEGNRLEADVTLANPGAEEIVAQVTADAVDAKGAVVWTSGPVEARMPANRVATTVLGGAWTKGDLWWPDRPAMHTLRVRVETPKGTDVHETPFGFREWSHRGKDFLLNGIVWRGWADLIGETTTKEDFLSKYRKSGQRFQRLSGEAQNGGYRWKGMPFAEALDFFDREGVVIRRSNILDGEVIGYMAVENDPELRKLYGTEIKKELLDRWARQVRAQVREERNHPSIHVWSIENEFLYINAINLYGGLMDEFEAAVNEAGKGVAAEDPTRLWMVDGGGAGKANLFPVHGDHYVYTNQAHRYPDLAYSFHAEGGGRGRWLYDGKRPRYAAEDFFASGFNPADYAWIQGEKAFGGKTDVREGYGLVERMLTEGYRWGGTMSHAHHWVGDEGAEHGKYVAFKERAAFVREYDRSFGSAVKVRRTVGVFNDSRYDEPLTLKWTVGANGASTSGSIPVAVPPGDRKILTLDLPMPKVAARTNGRITWSLESPSKGLVFQDVQPIAVHPAPAKSAVVAHVYDPKGRLKGFESRTGIAAKSIVSLAALPKTGVVVVGPDALSASEADRTTLAAYAAGGGRVVVLDHERPLGGPALPIELDRTTEGTSFLFPEDPTHPALAGLTALDLRGWAGGSARGLWNKPARGAKSLVQGGPRLTRTALVEVPIGPGAMWMSQLRTDLGRAPSARLVRQLVLAAANYVPKAVPVTLASEDPLLTKTLAGTGARFTTGAPTFGSPNIVVATGTPARLKAFAADPKLRPWLEKGGALVINGLGPDALASFDKITGRKHLIRPFRREKVAFTSPRHPLTIGMSLSDVAQLSGERMFDWNGDVFVSKDAFSYVVDLEDVAPFGVPATDEYLSNAVNGFVSADGWKYILSFEKPAEKAPVFPFRWSSPRTLREMTWIGNGFYHKVKALELVFDGGKVRRSVTVEPNIEPQTITIDPPVVASSLDVRITDWTKEPGVGEVVGIDNIFLKQSPVPAGRGMLNVGALVEYPVGKGRIVLANVNLKEREEVPENAFKKARILSSILRNLGASFADGKLVVAGAKGVTYAPVSFAGVANAFRDARGWFGDNERTFADLPAGRQTFADVGFDVYSFTTSPVPTVVVLGGDGVPGGLKDRVEIPVNAKANALFFLQTARVDRPAPANERPEIARYVVTFADGTVERVPILLNGDVADYRTATPLPGAAIGWSKPYTGGGAATAWVRQWNVTKPDVAIKSVALEYSTDRRAVPALLALTLAR